MARAPRGGAVPILPAERLGGAERLVNRQRKGGVRPGAERLSHRLELKTPFLPGPRELSHPEEASFEASLQRVRGTHPRNHPAQREPSGVSIERAEGQGRRGVAEGGARLGQKHAGRGLPPSKIVEDDRLFERTLFVPREPRRLLSGSPARSVAGAARVKARHRHRSGRVVMQAKAGLDLNSEVSRSKNEILHIDQPGRSLEGAKEPVGVRIRRSSGEHPARLTDRSHLRDGGRSHLDVSQSGFLRQFLEKRRVLLRLWRIRQGPRQLGQMSVQKLPLFAVRPARGGLEEGDQNDEGERRHGSL